MRIGYDVSQTGKPKAGCGYVAYSLGKALADIDSQNDYLLYPTFGDLFLDPNWAEDTLKINRQNFHRGLAHRGLEEAYPFWNNHPQDFEEQLGSPDIIHLNNFYCPSGIKRARLVYTLYDLSFLAHPEWTTETNRVICFEGTFKASLYADFVVAISDFSRRHFLETFLYYPPERMAVVPLASRFAGRIAPPRPADLSYLKPNQFWLDVATIEPRKNHRYLVEAYAHLKAEVGKTFPLVLAGGQGWLMKDFEEYLCQLGIREDVHLLGNVTDDDVACWLYKNCFAFIYPSLFEGFGLPVLEAMSQGAAVITSNTTSMPEVIGDAGLLVDPLNVESIYRAMRMLFEGEVNRSELQTRGFERSRLFSWETSARQVLSIYNHVMTLNKRSV
jgi:glycosyltransferase involved in cell wall biosynthesis